MMKTLIDPGSGQQLQWKFDTAWKQNFWRTLLH